MKAESRRSNFFEWVRAPAWMTALLAIVISIALGPGVAFSQQRGKLLTLATQNNVTTLDPGGLGTLPGWEWLISLAYDPLIWLEADGSFTPALATSWSFSDGNKKFALEIRPDVKFSDGTPLDGAAVAASLNYEFKNPAARAALYAPGWKGAEATGPTSVVISCDPACPVMPWLLTQFVEMGSIISPTGLKDPQQLGTKMFGAGPYVLNEQETMSGDRYVFDVNANYWNPSSIHYDRVVLRVIPDNTARLAALETGQVDLIDRITLQEASAIPGQLALHGGPENYSGLVIHDIVGQFTEGDKEGRTYSKPLSNILVRQALNYAVDRETLAKALGRGFGKPMGVMAVPGTTAYDPAIDTHYPYDPEKAKALLTEAGYPDGFTLDMTVAAFGPEVEDWAQATAQYWEAVGIKVNLNAARTTSVWIQQAQLAPSIFVQWGGGTPFGATVYYWFNKGTTYSQWHVDPELEKMVTEAAAAPVEEQAVLHKAMAKRAVEQGYWVAIARYPEFFAYNPAKIKLNMEQNQFAGRPIAPRITPVQ